MEAKLAVRLTPKAQVAMQTQPILEPHQGSSRNPTKVHDPHPRLGQIAD